MKKFVLTLEGEFEFEMEDDATEQDAIVHFFEEMAYVGDSNRLDYNCKEVDAE